MAKTDLVTSARQLIYVGSIDENSPNSESINSILSGNINYILNRLFFDADFTLNGYFNANAFDNGVGGIKRIESDAKIDSYYLSLRSSGSSGTNNVNVAVYNSAGGFINNLFGTGGNALSISGSNGTNVLAGREGILSTPSTFATNTGGHTVNYGNLNITEFLAGYVLVPFVVSNGTNAITANLSLRFKEN